MRKLLLFALAVSIANFGYSFTPNKKKDVGVLILAHGGKYMSWDETVKEAISHLKEEYYVEVAFGMANPETMQEGIDKLEAHRVKQIVVVPLFISSYSPIIRQNEYLLGLRDKLADPPMLMHHPPVDAVADSHGGGHAMHDHSNHDHHSDEEVDLEQLKFTAEIILTKPLNSHPLVAKTVFDRINELSENPANETILIVAHGPNDEEDNKNWIKEIDKIADQIRDLQAEKGDAFKQIFGLTVRDDANQDIYDQAKEQLRTLVYQAGKNGEVIVIPLLLSQGGVEERYVKRLEGLEYKWDGKTLLPHPNIGEFIELSVKEALGKV